MKKDKNNKQNKKLLEVCNETKKVVEDLFETALDLERSYSRFEANKIYREILELNIGYPKIEKMAKERLESN